LFYKFAIRAERNFRKTALSTVLFATDYSLKDVLDYNTGSEFSINVLFKDMKSTNLRALGTQFGVPMIFIQGTDDTLTSLLEPYYAVLRLH
jgi:hypothetical protein